ncbi:CAPSL [Cordylochernes scorpioides]|uniref:CAPSL n=1 Tax=Cordylochernes scorpioides TaxID=51811 RepID=A0ABY6KDB6_9ARAC|nr:CAPSL [Cordylochernes scorpioides]
MSCDLIVKLREACLARGASGILGIRRSHVRQVFSLHVSDTGGLCRQFKILDDNLDRKLDLAEFQAGLEEFGVDMDAESIAELFAEMDTDGTGTLHFEEFLKSLRPPMSDERVAMIRKAFQLMDKTGDGVVTIEDLRGVYNVQFHPKVQDGEITEDEAFEEFLKGLDTPNDPDGKITWGDFLDYYSGVSASIDTDEYFIEMMKSAWKMEDGDEE